MKPTPPTRLAPPFRQLHEECGSRIRYKKTCPIHGEVENDEIVSGYQYARDQYVVVEPDELDQLRSERDKAINIVQFVPADAIDPVYHSGRTYYLLPDGPIGQKPYALMRQTMAATGLHAIAKVVFSNREQLVLVRPVGEKLLGMTLLEYADQVKQPAAFADEVADAEVGKDEAKLARELLAGLMDAEPDLSKYHSSYVEKLKALIEARVEGEEVVAAPAEPPSPVINLMDALKASVAQVREPETPPRRKMATSTKGRKPTKRKNRTG